MTIATGGATERLRIDSVGRVLLGTTSNVGSSSILQVREDGFGRNLEIFRSYDSANTPARIRFSNSRGTAASPTIVVGDDDLGEIRFNGHDGTNYDTPAAAIFAAVDGTPGVDDMPGRLEFHTTSDGGSSTTEKLRITAAGNVGINKIAPADRLHVGGKIRFGNNSTYYGVIEHEEGVTGANIYTSADSGGHIFKRSTTTQAEINDTGIKLPAGAGINFSAYATSGNPSSNLLDDYEEGTWTPVVNKSGTTGTITSPNTAIGHYRKIGGLLFISFYWYKSSGSFGTTAGRWYISGIPFALPNLTNSSYNFISEGYHAMNGVNYNREATLASNGGAAGGRWQTNGISGNTLTLYGELGTINWSSATLEFSGSGCIMAS